MAYDSPKAAHFQAFLDGKELPPSSSLSIDMRWAAARIADIIGIQDMLHITEEQHSELARRLSSRESPVRLYLRAEYVPVPKAQQEGPSDAQ